MEPLRSIGICVEFWYMMLTKRLINTHIYQLLDIPSTNLIDFFLNSATGHVSPPLHTMTPARVLCSVPFCFLTALFPCSFSNGTISMSTLEWPADWKCWPTGVDVDELSRCSLNSFPNYPYFHSFSIGYIKHKFLLKIRYVDQLSENFKGDRI